MLAVNMDIFHRRSAFDVAVGSVFRRLIGGDAVETAEVLSVAADNLGIAHVRYRVEIRRSDGVAIEEQRILSLRSFRERFRERAERR